MLATFLVAKLVQLEARGENSLGSAISFEFNDSGPEPYETVDALDFKKRSRVAKISKVNPVRRTRIRPCVKDLAAKMDGQITRFFNTGADYEGNTLPPFSRSGAAH